MIRKILATIAVLGILVIVAGGLAWLALRTSWFADLVRQRLIAELQQTTGARVELKRFVFNPDTLHAELSGLVLHGTEPASEKIPLLSIDSADISFKIISLWSRSVDLKSILLHQPQVHILVNADGTTNLPSPKRKRSSKAPVEQLLDLKVGHLEVAGGQLTINDKPVPLDFASENLALLLEYDYASVSYGASLQSNPVHLSINKTGFKPVRLSAKGRLFKDRATFEKLELITGNDSSRIALSGQVPHFLHISADATLDADLSIDELAQLGDFNSQLRHGRGHAAGVVHFDGESHAFTFDGKASGQHVDVIVPHFELRDIGVSANVIADNSGIVLRHIDAEARGAHFSGRGSIKSYDRLEVDGNVSEVALREVGSYLTKQPFPWSGVGRGTAQASARLQARDSHLVIAAKVDIAAGTEGIPTSGNVDISYDDSSKLVSFGASTLQLPHTSAAFSGTLNSQLSLQADSGDLADLIPLLPIFGANASLPNLPKLLPGGNARFTGTLSTLIDRPVITGDLALGRFKINNYPAWDFFHGQLRVASDEFSVQHFELKQPGVSLAGSAAAQLVDWSFSNDLPVHMDASFSNLNVVQTAALFTPDALPFIQGFASGHVNLQGNLNNPRGTASVEIKNLDAYGEQLNHIQFDASLEGDHLLVSKGRVQSGPALLAFSGLYDHSPGDWSRATVNLKADTNGFPLSSLSSIKKYVPTLNANAEAHLDVQGKWRNNIFEPLRINGTAQFLRVSIDGRPAGNASLNAVTQGNGIDFSYSGDLRDTKFHGSAHAVLSAGTPIKGSLELERISLSALKSLTSEAKLVLPLDGYMEGGIAYDGLLEDPLKMRGRATVKDLEIRSTPHPTLISAPPLPDIVLKNSDPILIDVAAGVLTFSKFAIAGRDTSVNVSGYAPFLNGKPVEIKAVGKADLALFSLFDANVRSSGSSELAVNIAGPITAMNVTGALLVRNGSFFLSDISNGLSDVNGSVVFSRNRATIQKMTAHSGGGDISLGGSLSFSEGSPLIYHLEAEARNVRVRYANSISVTSNADLRLSGASDSSILSGTLTVTRVVFTPNADAGNLLAAASSSAAAPGDQGDFISGLHLDVSVESAPSLQVSTNLSRDVEAEIQLRLRGTPEHPIVLGNIAANQGDIKIFGTRFSLNRGEVSFVNTVRVEPVLDLDLETQARGVTVDITVSGTLSKLNFNYRSDPPLQPRDIIALLTVGRTPGVGTTSNAQGASDVTALSSGVNSVLGQAISPVSNRLSRLFGITNIKIDPFVQGITNTPQARLSVEQQISRNVTVTYVTNLSQTSEQIFRFEWALSRQFSVVAIRDDNGEFGIDFQYKKRFK